MNYDREEFVQVSKEEFFAAIGAHNIHPRSEREASYWENQANRKLVGISTPGYLESGLPWVTKEYRLHRSFVN